MYIVSSGYTDSLSMPRNSFFAQESEYTTQCLVLMAHILNTVLLNVNTVLSFINAILFESVQVPL